MEPIIVINGTVLTEAQAATVRVAISTFLMDMSEDGALGDDVRGQSITRKYRQRALEVERLLVK